MEDTRQVNHASVQDPYQLEKLLKSIQNGGMSPQYMKVASVALTAGNANAFAFAWQNPEDAKILVHRVLVDITTAGGTASSVLNIGSGASATTATDNLLDGIDANAAALYDNADETDSGTNGKASVKLDEKGGTTDWITGQILTANAASLVGNVYIYYTEVA